MTRDELINDLKCGTQIADDAVKHGYVPQVLAADGTSDAAITLWQCNGVRAIQTNGDTVWEESDPDGFVAMLKQFHGI